MDYLPGQKELDFNARQKENLLPCGHPQECFFVCFDTGDMHCRWCEELSTLRSQVRELREQIGKTALIVTGGTVHVTCPEKIGLLEMKGGSLSIEKGYYGGREPFSISSPDKGGSGV